MVGSDEIIAGCFNAVCSPVFVVHSQGQIAVCCFLIVLQCHVGVNGCSEAVMLATQTTETGQDTKDVKQVCVTAILIFSLLFVKLLAAMPMYH